MLKVKIISLGVCLVAEIFTKKQFKSLKNILANWKKFYPNASIVGHCDTGNTKRRPNFDVPNG